MGRIVPQEMDGTFLYWMATVSAVILSVTALSVSMVRDPALTAESRSRRFVIVDEAGRERGTFGIDSNGEPELVLLGARGTRRVSVALGRDDSPVITLMDSGGGDRIRISTARNGATAVSMLDAKGRERSWLGMDRKGYSALNLFDDRARPVAAFGTSGGSASGLSLLDSSGKERIGFGLSGQGPVIRMAGKDSGGVRLAVSGEEVPSLRLSSGKGTAQLAVMDGAAPTFLLDHGANKTIAQIRPARDGMMSMILTDGNGKASMIEPSRVVLGEDREVIWSAP